MVDITVFGSGDSHEHEAVQLRLWACTFDAGGS